MTPDPLSALRQAAERRCSFCDLPASEVVLLIVGPKPRPAHICDSCVYTCIDILAEDNREREKGRLEAKLASIQAICTEGMEEGA